MRPVNLIPLDERRGDQAPLRAGVASYAIVAALAVALVGTVLTVLAGNEATEKEAELAQLEQRQALAQQAASELAPYGEFASLSESRDQTVLSLAQSRFDWERVLSELALILPEDVWLETLAGSATSAQAAADPSGATAAAAPTLQITGCANGQEGVARFLAALKDIDGVTRVGMQRSELGSGGAGAEAAPDAGSGGSGCQTRAFIASFDVTVSFDAVPMTAVAPAPVEAAPATDTAAPAAEGTEAPATAEAPATDDGGVAATEAEQQTATDSAAAQSAEAQAGAEAVGVGAQ